MICYAIKNEEGKYLGIARDVYDHYWTEIEWAHLFRDVNGYSAKNQAGDFRNTYYPNCKVVKVEIREVKDE